MPWRTRVSRRTRCSAATSTFVLGASGHIAGVINPPRATARNYWINDLLHRRPGRLARARASAVPGSWWPHWCALARAARRRRSVAGAGSAGQRATIRALEPAPGPLREGAARLTTLRTMHGGRDGRQSPGGGRTWHKTTRVALVTGGMGGLGEAICIKLAALGYKVVTTYSPGNTKAQEWLDDDEDSRATASTRIPCDVADFDSCAACVAQGRGRGRPDRRAGQQRRHHARHDVQEDGQGELGRGDAAPISTRAST